MMQHGHTQGKVKALSSERQRQTIHMDFIIKRLHCLTDLDADVMETGFELGSIEEFMVLSISAAHVQDSYQLCSLFMFLKAINDHLLDNLDRSVMEIKAEPFIRVKHVDLVDLLRFFALQSLAICRLSQIFEQQRVILLHCALIVALRITIEIVRTVTRRKLNLPQRNRNPPRSMPHFSANLIQLPTRNPMHPRIASLPAENHQRPSRQIDLLLRAIVFSPVHDQSGQQADCHEMLLERGVRVEMRWDAVAGEVIVYCQLIEAVLGEKGKLLEFGEGFQDEVGDWFLEFLLLIDLITAILELIAIMLDPPIIQPLPVPRINLLKQLHFFLLRHKLLNHRHSRNLPLRVMQRRILQIQFFFNRIQSLLFMVQTDEDSGQILVDELAVIGWDLGKDLFCVLVEECLRGCCVGESQVTV